MNITTKILTYFFFLSGMFFHSFGLYANEPQDNEKDELFNLMEKGKSFQNSNPKEALQYFKKALQKNGNKNDSLASEINNRIGGCYYISGEYHLALDWYIKAFKINKRNGNKRGIAVGLNNIGIALSANGDEEKAIIKHLKSLEICYELNDTLNITRNLYNLGISYNSLNQLDKAQEFFEKALLGAEQLSNYKLIIQIYNQLGIISRKSKNYQESIDYHLKVIRNPIIEIDWEKSNAYNGLAACYYELGFFQKSIAFADSGMVIALRANVKYDICELSLNLAKAYSANHDYEKAYSYMAMYTIYHDSVWNEEKEMEINNIQLHYSEDLRMELEKNNQAQLELIEKKNYLLIAAGILLGIIISLFVIIYRSNKFKTITNRKLQTLNTEIQIKNKDLNDLNQSRDKLISLIAHDLKSPFNSLLGFSRILEEDFDNLTKTEQKEYIGIVHTGLENTYILLENLLIWSRSQGGHINFDPQRENLFLLSKQPLDAINISAETKSIKIKTEIPYDIHAEIDKDMFKTIIRNLLINAIKFTPEKGEVLLAINIKPDDEDYVEIKVKDNGIGIPEDIKDTLFQMGDTKSTLGTFNEPGTGLGLNICHDFIKIHGGNIWVESEIGKGSTFYFTLPKSQKNS